MIYLSILIPTLKSRAAMYQRTAQHLNAQIKSLENPEEVEVLAYIDNREKTTGYKRNILLERAKGQFVVFVDDDDSLLTIMLSL